MRYTIIMSILLLIVLTACSEEKVVTPPPECTMEDDPFTRGEKDHCVNDTHVKEYTCNGEKNIGCNCGCSEGACLQEGEIDFTISKKIVGDDEEEGTTWSMNGSVTNLNDYRITLDEVRLWATEGINPGQEPIAQASYAVDGLGPGRSVSFPPKEFTYNSEKPPVIWIRAYPQGACQYQPS